MPGAYGEPMDNDTSKLENIPPLGRSVEDVEADTQNRVNPPAHDEGRGDGTAVAGSVVAPLPIVNPSAQGVPGTIASNGAPIIGTASIGGALRDDVNEKRTNDDATDNSQS